MERHIAQHDSAEPFAAASDDALQASVELDDVLRGDLIAERLANVLERDRCREEDPTFRPSVVDFGDGEVLTVGERRALAQLGARSVSKQKPSARTRPTLDRRAHV